MTGAELQAALRLHPRANPDFFDTLVALRFLEREGDGAAARYRNTVETALFLDRRSPQFMGGFLEMSNARLYDSGETSPRGSAPAPRKTRSSTPARPCSPSSTASPSGSSNSWMR
jgi:hypothetical protein